MKILIAEDNAEYASLVKDALETAGFETVVASDGMKAHALVREVDFDLLLLDLAMPNLSGLEVARTLLRRSEKPPIIALSGYDAPEVREQAKAAGIDIFLSKDSGLAHVVEVARETLGA